MLFTSIGMWYLSHKCCRKLNGGLLMDSNDSHSASPSCSGTGDSCMYQRVIVLVGQSITGFQASSLNGSLVLNASMMG